MQLNIPPCFYWCLLINSQSSTPYYVSHFWNVFLVSHRPISQQTAGSDTFMTSWTTDAAALSFLSCSQRRQQNRNRISHHLSWLALHLLCFSQIHLEGRYIIQTQWGKDFNGDVLLIKWRAGAGLVLLFSAFKTLLVVTIIYFYI